MGAQDKKEYWLKFQKRLEDSWPRDDSSEMI